MKKPLVIAHRGFTRDFPDNTLEAFRAAREIGVDGVEFDVQETADGEFVVFHDDSINGKSISSLKLKDIQRLRVGGGYRIPTLQQALEVLGTGLVLLVELKQVRSLDQFLSYLRRQVDAAFTVLVSFDAALIARLSDLAPDFTCAVISDLSGAGATPPGHKMGGFTQVRGNAVSAETVKTAHDSGGLVFAWDSGSEDDLRRALRCGIDIIMTDRPDIVIGAIRRL
ncbi:MAG: glycerophosphodiester phosphodiesterase family protein [Chloroflexi bacterium]|nr:glycerophosphodiester phosphodiesterase family protein [Chloroflexota bacterium]